MLDGLIIGLVVGVVVMIYRAIKQGKGAKSVLAALDSGGPAAAREALDGYVAPVVGKVPQRLFLDLLERYSLLAVIGDFDGLEREARSIEGNVGVVTQLQAQAAAGLLAHRTEARDLEMMRGAAQRIEAEGGKLMGLVKKQLAQLAAVSAGLQQAHVPPEAVTAVHKRAKQAGKAARLVLMRYLGRVAEAAGADATPFQKDAAEALAALKK